MIDRFLSFLAGLDAKKMFLASCVLGAVYYFYGFDDGQSILEQTEKVSAEIKLEEKEQKYAQAAKKRMDEIRVKVATLAEKYKEVSQKLPSEITVGEIFKSIDTLGRVANVNVKVKEPGNREKKDILEEVPVKVNIEGNYSEITHFIYQIGSLQRIMRVGPFSLSLSSDRAYTGKVKMEGKLLAFRFIGESK
jgi:Tfp pilus assembly protein PilO